MERIYKELEKSRPSKKVLREELKKIQNQFANINEGKSLTDVSEFDEEIKYSMVVRNKGERETWIEDIENSHRYDDDTAVKYSIQIINDWNNTLRPFDKARELVRVVRHVSYKQSTALWKI